MRIILVYRMLLYLLANTFYEVLKTKKQFRKPQFLLHCGRGRYTLLYMLYGKDIYLVPNV